MTYTLANSNSEGIQRISEVYFESDDLILDCTYGKGNFWKFKHSFHLIKSDLLPTGDLLADFRHLPFIDQAFDVAVFDPPYYGHGAQTEKDFGRSNQTVGFLRKDEPIRNLYMKGLLECSRVVKSKGLIIVKVTDGCDYHPMIPWIVGLRIGKYLDAVVVQNPSLRNWTPNKTQRKLRTCHSWLVVLQNSYTGRA